MTQETFTNSPLALPPSRRGTRRVLAVRAMVGATSWLDGRLRWSNGRVAWESGGALVVPDAAELALAQRYHNKIRRYPISADLALGDSQAWLERRRARLELAKRLRALHAPDLLGLARQARAGDMAAIEQLVALLDAEALCLDRLPASPAAELAACGRVAAAQLRALREDEAAPLAARALAALVLGAIETRDPERISRPAAGSAWLDRAYAWGRRAGVPADPALILALLAQADGPALARRYTQTLRSHSVFRLSPDILRELLVLGVAGAQLVALAEAAASIDGLARRIIRDTPAPAVYRRRKRAAVTIYSLEQRRQLVADLADLLARYVLAARAPQLVGQFVGFVEAMLGLGQLTWQLADALLLALWRGIEQLPGHLLGAYLALLVEYHGRLWGRAGLPADDQPAADWLAECWRRQAGALLVLLAATGDAAIAREALALGMHTYISRYPWADPEICRWLLALVRAFDPFPADSDISEELLKHYLNVRRQLTQELCALLCGFTTARAARASLQVFADGLMAAPLAHRADMLCNALDELRRLDLAPRDTLPRLARYLPAVVGFVKRSSNPYTCWWHLLGLLALDRTLPEQAPAWIDWLLEHLLELESRSADGSINSGAISVAALFAATLAEGDFARFQAIFGAAMQRQFEQRQELLEQSIPVLARFPALRAALARSFAQQPHRCAALTVRVGLAARLGQAALTPLEELERMAGESFLLVDARDAERGWPALLELAPDLAALAASYLHAQWLLGGSLSVPAGARRAVEQPRALERELAYLQRALASRPDRADLAARAANLAGYLADSGRLLAATGAEVRERLGQATFEAQFAAAEQQALVCYRRRLADLAGPLPAGLQFDDDLLNATLLTIDIRHNRRLLLRLLRAHLAGDQGWRERHPANRAFLDQLAGRGCDIAAWLSAMPRAYRCASVAGGRVRLRLERSPLRILQMGNIFDTCLSFGGINSFSTVANACELNKRVIYATDGAGRVIGRKLIAIDGAWKLVGFHTYTALADDAGGAELRAIFHRYAIEHAARCGLELADDGTVPTLFAERWYDDGVVPWDENASAPSRSGRVGEPSAERQI